MKQRPTFRVLQEAWTMRHAVYEFREAKAVTTTALDSIRKTQAVNVAALNLIRGWLESGRFGIDEEVPNDLELPGELK